MIFRSEGEKPGIYSVPTLGGGDSTLIIKEGYLPRYSPDGSHIAYILGSSGSGGLGESCTSTPLRPDLYGCWLPACLWRAGRMVAKWRVLGFRRSNNLLFLPIHLWIWSSRPARQPK